MQTTRDGGRVAIVGGGPAGLVAAKSLLEEGLHPTVFQRSSNLGGQWNAPGPHSGVWKTMRANTSKVTMCFSDFPLEEELPMFLTNQQAHEYLLKYAKHFGLDECLKLNTRVEMVSRADGGGWLVESKTLEERREAEVFPHVIVAPGRFNQPRIPTVKGLAKFKGATSHPFDYRGNDQFKEKRVLVIGNGISGLEVASELATDPSITVISSCRKPRYIITKIFGGIPSDCAHFTRFGLLLNRAIPSEKAAEALKKMILKQCGSPEQYGGLKPADNIFEANISMSQYYLAQVAEGKIPPKEGLFELTEDTALFADGTSETIDAAVFATGYELSLPFLAQDIQQSIAADGTHIDLYCYTFHPDLPNLAFMGLYVQVGPYFPVLELQARWIAMVWNGIEPLPSREKMMAGIGEFQEWKKVHCETFFHEMAIRLSKEADVTPALDKHPELSKALLFGPLASSQFRLDGHGRRQRAATEFLATASTFGNITSPHLSEEQTAVLAMIARTVGDEPSLAALLQMLQRRNKLSSPRVAVQCAKLGRMQVTPRRDNPP